jgi:ubiquinone/menaquinone biosynthesis C-methylase UbiE
MNKDPLNINSVWTRQVEIGQQPSGKELEEHLSSVHDNNAGFTEAVAWNCRDINGKNSYELLADIIDKKHHSTILDLACGSGVLLDLCNRRYGPECKLSGVDMNEAELKLARKRLSHTDVKLYHSMAQDLNFVNDSSVDVILCHWALTLMDPVVPVLITAKRVLKENGIFAAIIDGDPSNASGYQEIHNIIYEHVRREHPNYGKIELGDPRVRTVEGINELATKIFVDFDLAITPLLLSLNASPDKLARDVAGFFYASFVLSAEGHCQMLDDLKNYLSSHLKDDLSCFNMSVNLIVIRQK